MSEPTTSITDSDMTMNNNTMPDQTTTQQTNKETQDDDQTMTPRRSSRRKKAPKMLGSPNHNDNIDELQHYHNNKNASHRSVPHSVESSSTGSSLTNTNHYNNSISININNTINTDEESTTQITSSAKERFVSSRGRGRSKANASNASNRRSRKQKIVLDALPIDAAKSFVNSGPQPDVPDIHLMSPNSKQAYEKNKRLPMKLRGKGTRMYLIYKLFHHLSISDMFIVIVIVFVYVWLFVTKNRWKYHQEGGSSSSGGICFTRAYRTHAKHRSPV